MASFQRDNSGQIRVADIASAQQAYSNISELSKKIDLKKEAEKRLTRTLKKYSKNQQDRLKAISGRKELAIEYRTYGVGLRVQRNTYVSKIITRFQTRMLLGEAISMTELTKPIVYTFPVRNLRTGLLDVVTGTYKIPEQVINELSDYGKLQETKNFAALARYRTKKGLTQSILDDINARTKSLKDLRKRSKALKTKQIGIGKEIGALRALARGNIVSLAISELLINTIGRDAEKRALKSTAKKLAKKTYKDLSKKVTKSLSQSSIARTAQGIASMQPVVYTDTSDFERKIQDYMRYTRKSFQQVVNEKAYWVTRNAMKLTKKASVEEIKSKYNAPSDKAPGLTVAEWLVLKSGELGKRPNKNTLKQMAKTFISSKTRATGFLRSGWIPALRILGNVLKKSTSPSGTKQFGEDKGTAVPATNSNSVGGIVQATITNAIEAGGKAPQYLVDGLEAGKRQEAANMGVYIKRKMDEAAAKWNTGGRF